MAITKVNMAIFLYDLGMTDRIGLLFDAFLLLRLEFQGVYDRVLGFEIFIKI